MNKESANQPDLNNLQDRLANSNEMFRTLAENTPAIIYILQGERFVYVNPSFINISGYSKDEAYQMTFWHFLTPESQTVTIKNMELRKENPNLTLRYEVQARAKDGQLYWLDLNTSPFTFNGKPATLVSAFDITKLKADEEALRISEARFKALSDASFEGIIISENGICINANQRACQFLGYEYEEMVGMPVSAMISPESRETVQRNMVNGYELPYEATVVGKDSALYHVEIQGRMFSYQGRQVRAASIRNLTFRKEQELEIEKHTRRFQALFYNSPDAVVLCDLNLLISDINPCFTELFGYNRQECLGQPLDQILVPHDLKHEYDTHVRLVLDGNTSVTETIRRTKDGRNINVIVKVIPVEYFGCFVIYSDISDRKRQEATIKQQLDELEKKNAEMERFTYTVSHDLRSPLITIKGFAGLLIDNLKRGQLERLDQDLERILNAANKMDDLLHDLLELSRVGRLLNPFTQFSMTDLVQEVVELITGSMQNKEIEILVSPALPDVVADRARIFEVMQNLIENGIKFMGDQTKPCIIVDVYDNNDEFIFSVSDNGIGIETRYYDTIFGLFEKLNPNVEGTGIGLSIVKRIIEFHQGRIWVESSGPGRGSTFYFSLPKLYYAN
ncbi:PAS domain-containing sensor histidine kinase [Syntrophomonas palmitatica]|uniref:PAS domain-containing sensor histidine kinase n=1 Tax=Syntrophomonas palmitatica TaxID=402877 RepID=UPI0006D0B4F1|nr:PAS domain S-box protein [Syntrophomonas palmitatica]